MSNFSKGKWELDKKIGNTITAVELEEAVALVLGYIDAEQQANARLIAAAPEMYYLLKNLTEELRAYGDDVREDLYSLMIEAERLLERIDGEEAQEDE